MNTRKLEELGDADEIYANPNGLRQTVDCRYPEGDLRKGLKPEIEWYFIPLDESNGKESYANKYL